ncbi:MAG: hypothetical protein HQ498_04675 [Pseudohongiella sp.]|nr:hypothetical protein [Pseudohongiella sp.]
MKSTKPLLFLLGPLMLGCTASPTPEYGLVDWHLNNGSNSDLTLTVYDKICKRSFFRIRLSKTSQSSMTTCGNSEGEAEIRYRRVGGGNVAHNPWLNTRVSQNQSLVVR